MDISNLKKGLAGQFYDTSPRTCLSFMAEEDIPFGSPLMRGTDRERQVRNFNGDTTTEFVGVAARSALKTYGALSTARPLGYYKKGDPVTVLKVGRIWVPLYGTQTITLGDDAYIDTAFDRISNVVGVGYIPIGRFLSGGTAATSPLGEVNVFVLELKAPYQLPTPELLRSESEEVSSTVYLKNQKGKK